MTINAQPGRVGESDRQSVPSPIRPSAGSTGPATIRGDRRGVPENDTATHRLGRA